MAKWWDLSELPFTPKQNEDGVATVVPDPFDFGVMYAEDVDGAVWSYDPTLDSWELKYIAENGEDHGDSVQGG